MIIDGITTCVGPEYIRHLCNGLPVWAGTLDSLTIVTDAATLLDLRARVNELVAVHRIAIHTTDAFTRNGAYFNKGAALNEGIKLFKRRNWVLTFDCDIMPCSDWRAIAGKRLVEGELYSAHRWGLDGQRLDPHPLKPKGYFLVWYWGTESHVGPTFAECYPHAGRYDTEFANHWGGVCVDLGVYLQHWGKRSTYWFGPETTPEQMAKAQREACEPIPSRTPRAQAVGADTP